MKQFTKFFNFAAIAIFAAMFASSCLPWDDENGYGPDTDGTAAAWNGKAFVMQTPVDYNGHYLYDANGNRYSLYIVSGSNCGHTREFFVSSHQMKTAVRESLTKFNGDTGGYDSWISRITYTEVQRHTWNPDAGGPVPVTDSYGWPVYDLVVTGVVSWEPCYGDCGYIIDYQCEY